jgi:hypothetical protein
MDQPNYDVIRKRLEELQPKNRTAARDAHLKALRESLIQARERGVSLATLSKELTQAGVRVSTLILGRFLGTRSTRTKARPHRNVRSGAKGPVHRESGTTPQ